MSGRATKRGSNVRNICWSFSILLRIDAPQRTTDCGADIVLPPFSILLRIDAPQSCYCWSIKCSSTCFQYPQTDRTPCNYDLISRLLTIVVIFQYPLTDRCPSKFWRRERFASRATLSVSSYGSMPLQRKLRRLISVVAQLSVSSYGSMPLKQVSTKTLN